MSGAFLSTINSLVPALVAAFVFTITSRYLSPTEFGLVAFAATIAMIASGLGPGGFGDALIQYQEIDERHLNSVFWACMAGGILICGILFTAAPYIAAYFEDTRLSGLVALLSLRVVFDMTAIVPNALLVRSMSFGRLALRTTVASLVSGAVCLALLFLGYGLWALAFSQLASSISLAIGAIVSANWRPRLSFDRSALREVERYGAFATGQRIVQMVSFDQLLIGALAGAHALGIFSFARRIHQLLNDMIGGGLRLVSFSVLSSMQTEPEKLRQAYLVATFVSSAVSFPLFCGLAGIATDVVPLLFGTQWTEAVPTLQAFCLLGLATCIGLLQSALINSQGNAAWWFYYQATQQILTAVVVIIVFPLGVTAIAFALVAKTIVLWPAAIRKTLQLLDMTAATYLRSFFAPAAASVAMLAAIALVQDEAASLMPLPGLLIQIGVGAITYSTMLAALAHGRLRQIAQMLISRKG